MIALAIILFFVVLALFLILHYKRFLRRKGVNHKLSLLIRIAALIPSTVMLTRVHPGQHFWVFICAAAMQGFTFWFLFDGLYNKLRNMPWNYPGGFNDPTEPDSSWLDAFLNLVGEFFAQVIKIVGIIVSILVYILSFIKLNQ